MEGAKGAWNLAATVIAVAYANGAWNLAAIRIVGASAKGHGT